MSMERDGAWSYRAPLSRACWTPSQVAENRHVAVWDPGPSGPGPSQTIPTLQQYGLCRFAEISSYSLHGWVEAQLELSSPLNLDAWQ